mmetsp:Transcript_16840/g.31175  ORF Transcript_16840/g.31175 Transcript_16840/m.31175 type:complete len:327 (+) Transcript_16840:60-1040(+)
MGTAASTSFNAPKTIVLGGNGCVGLSTLEALLLRGNGQLNIHCGVRNVEKFKKTMIDIPTVKTHMEDVSQMAEALRGFDRAFIIVPSSEDRTELALNALEAAKLANIKFVLLLSVTIAASDTIFGRQFMPLEEKISSLGIPYTIIRLPMFLENMFMHGQSVAKDKRICDPRKPSEEISFVTLEDVGKCAAEILINPSNHINRTYKLVSGKFSMNDMSESLSKILHKKIGVKETSWNQFRRHYLDDAKIPKWQADGTIEWMKCDRKVWISGEDQETIKNITGDNPVTLHQFVAQNASVFGWKRPLIVGGDKDVRDDPIMQFRSVYAS